MGALISGFITTEKLEEILKTVKARQAKGFAFTASVSDQSNNYGQNVGFYAEQTKEQRDAKAPKYYFGNGKVFWTDGKIAVAAQQQQQAAAAPQASHPSTNDLPF